MIITESTELNPELRALGEALMKSCPANDCTIYRMLYTEFMDMEKDIEIMEAANCSERAVEAVKAEMYRTKRSLADMYCGNFFVRDYRHLLRRKGERV